MLQHHPESINPRKVTLEIMASEIGLYWKNLGKPNDDLARKRAKEFLELVESKSSRIAEYLHTNSPIQRKWFTELTGINLGKINKDMKTIINKWSVN